MGLTLVTKGVGSGMTAGALLGLVAPPLKQEVTAGRPSRLALPAVVHTSIASAAADRTTVDGIPATAPARTVIDLGGAMPAHTFEDVLDTAIVQGLVSMRRLEARARELWTPRRRGCAVVLELLAARRPELARAANVREARVLRIVHDLGVPPPRVNHRVQVGGRRRSLDLAWPT